MSKRVKLLLVTAVTIATLLTLSGVALAGSTASPEKGGAYHGGGWGGGRWDWGCGQAGLEAAAEALGMSADELSTQRWGGRSLADLAERQGKDLATVQAAVDSACLEVARQAIEAAVTSGRLSRAEADWLLEGLESGFTQGYSGRRHGLAGNRSLKSAGRTAAFEAVADGLGLTPDQLRSELQAGKTVASLADEQRVGLQALRDAAAAAAREASRKAVEQAVKDGTINREHGDWLLEGLDAGYWGTGGFGSYRGFGGVSPFKPTPAPQGTSG